MVIRRSRMRRRRLRRGRKSRKGIRKFVHRFARKDPEYLFHRYVSLANNVSISNAAITTDGYSFQLDEVPSYTEFTALFDLYQIVAVRVTIVFNSNNIQVQSAVPFNTCRWVSVIDYNSSTGFAGVNDAREFQTAKVLNYPSWKGHASRYIHRPRFLTYVEDNGGIPASGGNNTGWLNTQDANIPHFGYRYIFDQLTAPYTGNFDVEAVYYMKFRRVK